MEVAAAGEPEVAIVGKERFQQNFEAADFSGLLLS